MTRRWLCIFVALLLAGCSAKHQQNGKPIKPMATAPPPPPPAPVIKEQEQQLTVAQPQSRHPAREGKPPLVYLLESPANVEVVDSSDGTIVARATLAARSIISIDSTDGVRAANEQLAKGPLSAQHTYQIFIVTGTENTYRTEIVLPGGK